MSKRETFLASEELGDSLDAVEGLIKKHEDMDKSLQAQASVVMDTIPLTPTHHLPPCINPSSLFLSLSLSLSLCSCSSFPLKILLSFHRKRRLRLYRLSPIDSFKPGTMRLWR